MYREAKGTCDVKSRTHRHTTKVEGLEDGGGLGGTSVLELVDIKSSTLALRCSRSQTSLTSVLPTTRQSHTPAMHPDNTALAVVENVDKRQASTTF